jgi:hypothetical protein
LKVSESQTSLKSIGVFTFIKFNMNIKFNGKMLPKELWGKGLDSSDKILMEEIISFCKQPGGCYAGDEHFSDLLEESIRNVNRRIQKLKEQGRIEITTIRNGKKNKRYIKYISLTASAKIEKSNHVVETDKLSPLELELQKDNLTMVETDNMTKVNRQDVSGIIQYKEATLNSTDSVTVSNSRNEVEVRHARDQNILDQNNTSKENLQIVPHSPLRCDVVRDYKVDQEKGISTEDLANKTKVGSLPRALGSSNNLASKKGTSFWDEEEGPEFDENDIKAFRTAVDDLFKEEYPKWYTFLQNKPLFEFINDTSHIHGRIPEIIEVLTILKNDIKKRSQGR